MTSWTSAPTSAGLAEARGARLFSADVGGLVEVAVRVVVLPGRG